MMNTQQYAFRISLLSWAILAAHSAFAAESLDANEIKSLNQLDAISVMASRGSDLKDMDMSTTIIQHEQIQNAPQTSIDQIINKIPGVFAPARLSTQIHPTGQLLNIRGLMLCLRPGSILMYKEQMDCVFRLTHYIY